MSQLAVELSYEAHHTGGVPGLYKICQNCGRNFFRCIGSTGDHCCECEAQIQPASFYQLWCCDECGMFRAWGYGKPQDTAGKRLKCSHCADVTRHEFWKVA